MIIFDLQRFSVHDGPGIRTTVFLKGCPLRCLWCQNPEGLEFGLGDAGDAGKVREISPADLAEELLADEVFFETSGGGVTFSGGEPLAQVDELIQTARLLRSRGIHVAVETSLYVPAAFVRKVLGEVDLIHADLKAWNPDDHKAWTGRSNTRILANFRLVADAAQQGGPTLIVRTPLVPEHTASEANLGQLREFLSGWSPAPAWELMDFNALARSKYQGMGRNNYPFEHLSTGLGAEQLQHFHVVAGLADPPVKETSTMVNCIRDFVTRAQAGNTVYITDVRQAFERLSASDSFRFGLDLTLPDKSHRKFVLRLPHFATADDTPERTFVVEYFLAELYNRLSALGPRRLEFLAEEGVAEAPWLHRRFEKDFGLSLSRKDRRGYGRAVNVLERMVDSLEHTHGSRMTCSFMVGPVQAASPTESAPRGAVATMAKRALEGVEGRTLLGIDVGGSDIKLALSLKGRLAALKEYDWFPAKFTRISSLTDPLEDLVKLMTWQAMALGAAGKPDPELEAALAPAFAHGADDAALQKALRAAAPLVVRHPAFQLDGIGHSFPDVVVRDKIVGGEVYKTRGIRDNGALDYEAEFQGLTNLDVRLRPYVRPEGLIATVNDGPMAAFTALVEQGAENPRSVADGIFAHSLGTELGTGWVTENGVIPDVPLEVYNFIIDLGSYPEREFACDDPRSNRNFNTDLPGTLQKYTSQSGAFRLALKYFPGERKDLMAELAEKGFVVPVGASGMKIPPAFRIPTEPKDLRKPFLEYLMSLPDRDGHPTVEKIFTEIGEFLAVATLECNQILGPAAQSRILFGRMVKNAACFRLMQKGARSISKTIELVPAADDLAVTKLMKELKADPDHTVAQFAQAVGAIYYAASRLGVEQGAQLVLNESDHDKTP